MDFVDAFRAACRAGEGVAGRAAALSVQDRLRSSSALSALRGEKQSRPRRRGLLGFLTGAGEAEASGGGDEAVLSTDVSRHRTDEERAGRARAGFAALGVDSRLSGLPEGLPRSLSARAGAERTRCEFVLSNDLPVPARRRGALSALEQSLAELGGILDEAAAWSPSPPPAEERGRFPKSGLKGAVGTARRQMVMDFSGAGRHGTVTRIWLPVPASRRNELVALGARWDPEGPRRGSRLWVPLEEAGRFDHVLPLGFRREPTRFAYPPIRHGAVGQNLGKVFDRESWSRLRFDSYDRAGHRCQICGRQGGKLWERIASAEERRSPGPVDCHEVWDWEVPEPGIPVGIQRLRRLLVVCKDCHLTFHEGYALARARRAGIEDEVKSRIEAMRMLVNRLPRAAVREAVARDAAAWEANLGVTRWVLDLSVAAAQEVMHDHILVLDPDNAAGVSPDMVGGVRFRHLGRTYAAVPAEELARGAGARPES